MSMPVVLGAIVTCPEVGSGDIVTLLGVPTKTGAGYPRTFMGEYGFEHIP